MPASKFQCLIGTTDADCPLGLELWIDQDLLFNTQHVTGSELIEFDLLDDGLEHELRIIMKNKTLAHTQIDASGQITKDACLVLHNISFDDIELNHLFAEHAVYRHNLNGTADWRDDKMFETLGCNGTVSFKFSTPIYLWLLEHM